MKLNHVTPLCLPCVLLKVGYSSHICVCRPKNNDGEKKHTYTNIVRDCLHFAMRTSSDFAWSSFEYKRRDIVRNEGFFLLKKKLLTSVIINTSLLRSLFRLPMSDLEDYFIPIFLNF